MIAAITKWGNSRGVRIPKPYLEGLNLSQNDIVDISVSDDAIIIRKSVKKYKTIEQRFEEFYGIDFDYDFKLTDWARQRAGKFWTLTRN